MLFFFWEESFVIVLEHLIIVKISSLKDIFLFLWHLHVKDIDRSSCNSWVFESVIFDCIGNFYGSLHIIFIKDIREKFLEILISHLSVYIRIVLRQDRVEDYSTNGCLNRLIILKNYDFVFQSYLLIIERINCFLKWSISSNWQNFRFPFFFGIIVWIFLTESISKEVDSKHHILWMRNRWISRTWLDNIFISCDKFACFFLCFIWDRKMHRHLITIKVGVKRRTY